MDITQFDPTLFAGEMNMSLGIKIVECSFNYHKYYSEMLMHISFGLILFSLIVLIFENMRDCEDT